MDADEDQAAALVFDARGGLDQLQLTVPLHSLDLGLLAVLAVAIAILAAVLIVGIVLQATWLPMAVGIGGLGMAGLATLPRLTAEERLELVLEHRSLALTRSPLGQTHHLALEDLSAVRVTAGQLVVESRTVTLNHALSRTALQHSSWLVRTLQDQMEQRRERMEASPPASLGHLLDQRT